MGRFNERKILNRERVWILPETKSDLFFLKSQEPNKSLQEIISDAVKKAKEGKCIKKNEKFWPKF